MMKKMKARIMATLMVMIMVVMSLTTMVSAEELDVTGTLIIRNITANTSVTMENKTFAAYEIFNYIVETDAAGNVTSLEYDVKTAYEGFFENVLQMEATEENVTEFNHAAMEYVEGCKADLDAFTVALLTYIDEEGIYPCCTTDDLTMSSSGGTQTYTITGMEAGYYLVVDATSLEDDAANALMANALATVPGVVIPENGEGYTLQDVIIDIKGSQPTINKEVWHNDVVDVYEVDRSPLEGYTGSWDVVSDYEIGDVVEYRVTATIPTDYTGYDSYTYIITDTLPDGITYNSDATIYYDAALTNSTANAAIKFDTTTHSGNSFEIVLDAMGVVSQYGAAGSTFYVYYTGTVTESVNVFEEFETNTVYLEYSNDPYSDSTNKISSSADTYTFSLDVLKTIGDGVTPLSGAVFALYSKDTVGGDYTPVYLSQIGETNTYAVNNSAEIDASEGVGVVTTDSTGVFEIVGLDDQVIYELREVIAPNGYNAADPMEFKIVATYNSSGVPTLTVDSAYIEAVSSQLSVTVVNTTNKLLPSTGGTGTTIFMIVGFGMMIGAVTLLVVKRRKAA